MTIIDVRCEIRKNGFTITFNDDINSYETIIDVNGEVRIFNIRSIKFIDDIAIIEGQAEFVNDKGVGILTGIRPWG